jgi:hypothetical protein
LAFGHLDPAPYVVEAAQAGKKSGADKRKKTEYGEYASGEYGAK